MLQRYVLVANAIISFIFGLGLIFAANAVLGPYGGMSMEPVTDQLFGAALVGTAVLNVLGRDVTARDARRAILGANFVYNAIVVLIAPAARSLQENCHGSASAPLPMLSLAHARFRDVAEVRTHGIAS
jgi:hypothetical protein